MDPVLVSSLISDLYDAALEPERWPQALSCLKAALGFEQATVRLCRRCPPAR
jgi:hypothetical protein